PLDIETIDKLTFQTGLTIVPYVTTATEIHAAISVHYLKGEQAKTTDRWVVLVAEDSELVRSTVVAAIKRAGYKPLEAADGGEALKIAIQQKPHLVLADIMMPQVDGYEMFRSLQANPATKNIPVIALSARSTPEEEARLLNAGFFDFIPKPLNAVRLLARLKRALRHTYGPQIPPVG
ncbi:MAG TPA: response regulator, partial [Desulfuromonadales bacterium]|nr:response regulator [Desulfuromonadales bacterium]